MHYHLYDKEEIKYYEKTSISCFISNYDDSWSCCRMRKQRKSDDSDKKTSSDSKSDDKKDSGKKVTVVTSGTGEPYSLISDDGKWTGIDAEMWVKLKNVPDGK